MKEIDEKLNKLLGIENIKFTESLDTCFNLFRSKTSYMEVRYNKFIPYESLIEGKDLTIYQGFDLTSPTIALCNAMLKLLEAESNKS